jgi:rhodanese-related sulfurtransferase
MNVLIKFLTMSVFALCGAAVASEVPTISGAQLESRIEKVVILDVRTPEEFAAGHVPGARNIPHDQLPNRIAELTGIEDREVVVYCRSGRRAATAQDTLAAHGFKRIIHLEGDMLKWEAERRPISK